MRCHACDGRTNTLTVESRAVFSLNWIRNIFGILIFFVEISSVSHICSWNMKGSTSKPSSWTRDDVGLFCWALVGFSQLSIMRTTVATRAVKVFWREKKPSRITPWLPKHDAGWPTANAYHPCCCALKQDRLHFSWHAHSLSNKALIGQTHPRSVVGSRPS